jgi:hypothetical protein
MHIKRAANSGYIVRHDYDNQGAGEAYMPSTEHVFSSHGSMLKHVQSCMGPLEQPGTFKAAPTKAQGMAAARKHGRGVD